MTEGDYGACESSMASFFLLFYRLFVEKENELSYALWTATCIYIAFHLQEIWQ